MAAKLKIGEKIMRIVKDNGGVITTAEVSGIGIARANLKALADSGCLEKTARGVYALPGAMEDEFVNLQARFKKGVFSKGTALFLYDLTDRTPHRFSMTFPDNYNLTKVKESGIDASRAREQYYSLGITEVMSPSGNPIKAYGAEKALCDLLRPRSGADSQLISEAFKRYVSRRDKNIPKLSECAKALKVEGKVRSYLEVLL